MKLSALQLKTVGDSVELSWKADNRLLRLKISGTGMTLPGAADAAFASCLIPAMLLGQELRIDESFLLSADLEANLTQFQQLYSTWFGDIHKTDMHIEPDQIRAQPIETKGNAVFYSGGIDASYSFFELKAEIDHLIFCLGLDIQLNETERCRKALEGAQQFAGHYGKNLIVIETNFRAAFSELSAKQCQVVLLITYSLALGLRRLYVPASHDALELEPYRTHPMTDPLLTNGATEVIHHGMASRVEKTLLMATSAQALAFLRVCNDSDQFNCGKCEKCLRTMATLCAIGKQSTALPVLDDVTKLRRVRIWSPGKYHMWHDIQCCAEQHGAFALAKEVRKLCRAYEWKQFLKLANQHFVTLLKDFRYFFAR
jgi:hypothetical protein